MRIVLIFPPFIIVKRAMDTGNYVDLCLTGETFGRRLRRLLPDLPVGPSIDWVSISQVHPPGVAPPFGAHWSDGVSVETGEPLWHTLKGAPVLGSFRSHLILRSFLDCVSLDGNPSRWDQPHSLEGIRSGHEALAVLNSAVRSASPGSAALPPFSEPSPLGAGSLLPSDVASFRRRCVGDAVAPRGASLSRIDVCWTFSAGSAADAREVLSQLSRFSHGGRLPRQFVSRRGDMESVVWAGGPKRPYIAVYSKGPELLKHAVRDDAEVRKVLRSRGVSALSRPDLRELGELATREGWLRLEVRLRRRQLVALGLTRLTHWDQRTIVDILKRYSPFEGALMACDRSEISERLLALGVSPGRASRASAAVAAWSFGENPFAGVSRATRYRVLADLRLVGWDISTPSKVVPFVGRVRTIVLRPAVLPAKFRRQA